MYSTFHHHMQVSTLHSGQASGRSGNLHVICVYTKDFTDQDDVMRVERGLRDRSLQIQARHIHTL